MSRMLFRPINIPTGLVAYWPLSESGQRNDLSGNANHLSDNNTVGIAGFDYWSTGENSADFGAASFEYLSIADASQIGLDFTGSYTFAGWIRPESFGGSDRLYSKTEVAPSTGYNAYINSTQLVMVHVGTGAAFSFTFLTNRWYHIALVYNSVTGKASAYVNGNLIGIDTLPTPTGNSEPFLLGSYPGSSYYDGLMKDAAFWSVALSPIQIKSLALGQDLTAYTFRPNHQSLPVMTAYWKGNEPVLTGARADSGPNAHNLTDNSNTPSRGGYIEGAGVAATNNGEYLKHASHANFQFAAGNFSMGGWYYFGTSNDNQGLMSKAQNAGQREFELGLVTGGNIRFRYSTDGTAVTTTTCTTVGAGLRTGVWVHIILVRSGNTGTFYINGIADGTTINFTAVTIFSGTDELRIGHSNDLGLQIGSRWADVFILKGTALTSAQVKSLACGLDINQQGMVAYCKMDEASGQLIDASGNSKNFTDNNTVGTGAGRVGTARDFVAANSEYFSRPDDIDFDPINMTILAFCNVDGIGVTNNVFAKKTTGFDILFLRHDATLDDIRFVVGNGSTNVTAIGPTVIAATTWNQCGGRFDGAEAVAFVNGKGGTPQSMPGSFPGNSSAIEIGRDVSAGDYSDMLVDELLFFKRAIFDEEVTAQYIKGINGKEATSSEITDDTGSFLALL